MFQGVDIKRGQQQAAYLEYLELQAQERAYSGLIDFILYTLPGFEPAKHHEYIAEKLEEVEAGEVRRLMVLAPPGHGKSELVSRRFPAWYLGRHPDRRIIAASYGADLATDFGRDVRRIVASDEYGCVFGGLTLSPDTRAANRWNTSEGGQYVAAGVGSGITGRRAHLAIIDDPVKSREEADSATRRDRVWSWYTQELRPRLYPDAAVVLIMTRWHDDDLAGRLLRQAEGEGETWDVVSLPALAGEGDVIGRKAGEALWPAWFPLEALETTRSVLTLKDGPRAWEALYQQSPVPEEGHFFKNEWIDYYPWGSPPEALTHYGVSDYAVTAEGGDYTVHGVFGVDAAGEVYVLDWWRRQADSREWVEAVIDLMLKWRPVAVWAEESGQIEKGVGPFLKRRMRERGVYCIRKQFTSTASKTTRAQAIAGRMSMGMVHFPKGAPWTEALVSELLRFPAGVHDDQVDALSLFGRMLADVYGPAAQKKPEAKGIGSTEFIMSMIHQMATQQRYGMYD